MFESQFEFRRFLVPEVQIENKPVLVQIVVWRLTADKPLSEPTMEYLIHAYMRYWVRMS